MEALCKLYLELSLVVPGTCQTQRELALMLEVQQTKSNAYQEAKKLFDDTIIAQSEILNLLKWLKDENEDKFSEHYGAHGTELLNKALSKAER